MHQCRITPKHGIGEVSSKYGYDRTGELFEKDMKAHQERHETIYKSFVDWLKKQDIDPDSFRYMFTRYFDEFIKTNE